MRVARWFFARGIVCALVAATGCGGHGRAGAPTATVVGRRGLQALARPDRAAAIGGATGQAPIAVQLSWPVTAPVSSAFGPRDGRPHEGVDFRVPTGTPVRAAAAGAVIYAGSGLRGYGRLVVLEHDARVITVYAHNSRILVGDGERVGQGQVLALSGATGRVTAPHLHFELRVDGVPRDPLPHLGGAPRLARGDAGRDGR